MSQELQPGLSSTLKQTVLKTMLANQVGSGSVPVFATPELALLLEKVAVATLNGHLAEGQTTVGTTLNINHLAPTPLGMTVSATATLIAVEGRQLTFEVSATDEREPIAKGTHTRFIVDAKKFTDKAQAKSNATAR